MGMYYGEKIYAVSFAMYPLTLTLDAIFKEWSLGLPAISLTLDELKSLGFDHPLPPTLQSVEADVLEKLFKAADQALSERYGDGKFKSLDIYSTLRDCLCTFDFESMNDEAPAWLGVYPYGSLARRQISFVPPEIRKGLNKAFMLGLKEDDLRSEDQVRA